MNTIIPSTKYCPKSQKRYCKLKANENKVDFQRKKYVELPKNDRVEFFN